MGRISIFLSLWTVLCLLLSPINAFALENPPAAAQKTEAYVNYVLRPDHYSLLGFVSYSLIFGNLGAKCPKIRNLLRSEKLHINQLIELIMEHRRYAGVEDKLSKQFYIETDVRRYLILPLEQSVVEDFLRQVESLIDTSNTKPVEALFGRDSGLEYKWTNSCHLLMFSEKPPVKSPEESSKPK